MEAFIGFLCAYWLLNTVLGACALIGGKVSFEVDMRLSVAVSSIFLLIGLILIL